MMRHRQFKSILASSFCFSTLGILLFPLQGLATEGQDAAQGSSDASQTPTTVHIDEVRNMQADGAGVAVNGTVSDANLNNNQNANANYNIISPKLSPVFLNPTQGGSSASALVMPRNPLSLPNAVLGRSNFGLQFGVQNYPSLTGGTAVGNGSSNALGWFMQGGVTIPFGKIPDVATNPRSARLDDVRQENQQRDRMVFGNTQPSQAQPSAPAAQTQVQGKVMGLSAYNFSTLPAAKINLPEGMPDTIGGEATLTQPKLLGLMPSTVYSKPLNTGAKVGVIEVGNEYPYLGHTRSGWVKVLLPNGTQGWTQSNFEYIKHDFTEIDNLALHHPVSAPQRTASRLSSAGKGITN